MSKSIRRALISVSDKTGIVGFAKVLCEFNVHILSTGGTAKLLREEGIDVEDVSQYTGFPELMEGRLKTLHPKVHGGILGRRGIDDAVMTEHGIVPIDLVVVNLYPFSETIRRGDCDLAMAIENIDIGGPTMVRAAAKNYTDVAVVTDVSDYPMVIEELRSHQGAITPQCRMRLACKAFEHTAHYDGSIANYLGTIGQENLNPNFPRTLNLQFQKKQDLRYGENPHQSAAFYTDQNAPEASIATSAQIQGKPLSFNNIADTDTALECVKAFSDPACVIVKHACPCGVAMADSVAAAYDRAFAADPTSAFGGIIALNRELDESLAATIIEKQFVEVIIAPTISDAAKSVLQRKQNVRVLACGEIKPQIIYNMDLKRVTGGVLAQDGDQRDVADNELKVVTQTTPSAEQLADLCFAWKIVKFVKSNAIVYARDLMTFGIGAGQTSRVYSAKIAALKAEEQNLSLAGSVMASDAFFPFRDSIDEAARAGIAAVIQPGGSMRDEEVIKACDEHRIAMVLTGFRHFRH